MRVSISPVAILRAQLAVIAALVLAHVATQFSKYFLGHDHLLGFVRLTFLSGETTIPAWYSSSVLLASAVTLTAVALIRRARGDRSTHYWWGLAVIFAYLSLDESAAIHETWDRPFREYRSALGGFLRWTWVIPGLAVVLTVLAVYARFVWHLPSVTRRLFVFAGFVFVGSALGVEMISARHVSIFGSENFTYVLYVACEEGGEMMGVAIFLYAAVRYLTEECSVNRLVFENGDEEEIPKQHRIPLPGSASCPPRSA